MLAVKGGKLIIKVTVAFLTAIYLVYKSPRVRESKTFLDSGFHAVDSGFQVIDSGSLCQWNLDSGLQSLAGLRYLELDYRFHKQKFHILVTPDYLTWGNTKYIERIEAFPKIYRSI